MQSGNYVLETCISVSDVLHTASASPPARDSLKEKKNTARKALLITAAPPLRYQKGGGGKEGLSSRRRMRRGRNMRGYCLSVFRLGRRSRRCHIGGAGTAGVDATRAADPSIPLPPRLLLLPADVASGAPQIVFSFLPSPTSVRAFESVVRRGRRLSRHTKG